jgi:hypothetical protein
MIHSSHQKNATIKNEKKKFLIKIKLLWSNICSGDDCLLSYNTMWTFRWISTFQWNTVPTSTSSHRLKNIVFGGVHSIVTHAHCSHHVAYTTEKYYLGLEEIFTCQKYIKIPKCMSYHWMFKINWIKFPSGTTKLFEALEISLPNPVMPHCLTCKRNRNDNTIKLSCNAIFYSWYVASDFLCTKYSA